MEDEIHQLADHLGNDHDLMVLKEKILEDDFSLKDEGHKSLIIAIINEHSIFLRSAAKIKGELIYAEIQKISKTESVNTPRINWN